MKADWVVAIVMVLAAVRLTRDSFRLPDTTRRGPALLSGLLRGRPTPHAVQSPRRPIEATVEKARVLAVKVHRPPRGTSFAKYQGWCSAYDRALAEGCQALGLTHLLDVLEPGPEREAERARVESLLWLAGLRIDEAS